MWCHRCQCMLSGQRARSASLARGKRGSCTAASPRLLLLQMASDANLLVHRAGHEEQDLSARYLSMPLPLGGSASGRRRALSADMATAHAAASRRGSWPVPPGLPSGAQLPLGLVLLSHPCSPVAWLHRKP